ncbi:MAG: leucyl/phenylalanyl-tRNA--protein transferase [Pseudomonadota bacterium]
MQEVLHWLDDSFEFPDPATALKSPNGLLAVGGDLQPMRLLQAYQRGIFPWFDDDQPPLWWTPDPRMVLFPDELHISRSLQKVINNSSFLLSSDRAFAEVLAGCAAPRKGANGTWITHEMQQAYRKLHELGFAHSLEVWHGDVLVGGLYGLAIGKVFFGESMFSRESNASKIAFVHAVQTLAVSGVELIDCQVANPHLESLGARTIPRKDFMQFLPACTKVPKPAYWPYNTNHTFPARTLA